MCLCLYRCMWRARDILGVICQVPFTLIFEIGLLMAWNSSLKSVRCRHLAICLPSAGISIMCHYAESSFLSSEDMSPGLQARKTVYWLSYLPSPKCSRFCWHPSFYCLMLEHLSTRRHAIKYIVESTVSGTNRSCVSDSEISPLITVCKDMLLLSSCTC